MSMSTPRGGVLHPIRCLSQGYALVSPQFMPLVGICFVGTLIGSLVPAGVLLGPMLCGIHLCMRQRTEGEQATFDLLFKGFDHASESIVAMLIFVGFYIALVVPAYMAFALAMLLAVGAGGARGQPSGPLMGCVILIGAMVFICIALLLSAMGVMVWSTMGLIVDRKLKAWPAVKTAFSGFRINVSGAVGLAVVCGLVHMLGILCCGVGVFFTTPVCMAAYFCAYRTIFASRPPPLVPEGTSTETPEYDKEDHSFE